MIVSVNVALPNSILWLLVVVGCVLEVAGVASLKFWSPEISMSVSRPKCNAILRGRYKQASTFNSYDNEHSM